MEHKFLQIQNEMKNKNSLKSTFCFSIAGNLVFEATDPEVH